MSAPVDASAINDMARLIAAMNQGVSLDEKPVAKSSSPVMESAAPSTMADAGAGDVAAMKSILAMFNTQTPDEPVKALNERAEKDRELREALMTESTARGTRVGNWEIITNEDQKGLKSFDIVNVASGDTIAEMLTVYDAALGITRLLNEGLKINSSKIRDILNLEAQYDSSRRDAKLFRERSETCARSGNSQKQAVMEARYVESLEKAKSARKRLSSI